MPNSFFDIFHVCPMLFVKIDEGVLETVECLLCLCGIDARPGFKIAEPPSKSMPPSIIYPFEIRKDPGVFRSRSDTVSKIDETKIIGQEWV